MIAFITHISNAVLTFDFTESDDGDGDATNTKVRLRTREHATYDAPDEDDLEVIQQSQRAFLDGEEFDEDENDEQFNELDEENEHDTSTQSTFPRRRRSSKAVNGLKNRRDRIIMGSSYVTNYRFDYENGSWCEIELQVILMIF